MTTPVQCYHSLPLTLQVEEVSGVRLIWLDRLYWLENIWLVG